jgi:3-dehydroquinate dehydratase type I
MKDVLTKLSELPDIYDVVEIWINEIEDLNLENLFNVCKKPVVIKITDSNNTELIETILKKNVAFMDIDIKSDYRDMIEKHKKKTKLIVSYHNFETTPLYSDILELARGIKERGADIGKIVMTANNLSDNLVPLKLLANNAAVGMPLISFCMGKFGKMSRIYAGLFGSEMNFVPPDEDWKTADGQLILKDWTEIQNIIKT